MAQSRQAQAVARALHGLDHPTADEVFQEVRKDLPRVSLATVYRNLDALVEEGEARVRRVGSQRRYDPMTEPHVHLHCTACDRLMDMPLEGGLLASLQGLASAGGMAYGEALVEVRGLCPECRAPP